ncbi:NUDIX hydrolase [Spirosoma sp. KUDC1026]|uniref:NUDIX hydrolase n=1 Tax=Spirosoma sp. KUDC1026 TaxID=2745947 RepID=UPI00159BA236|nr:NUDIX domain-containing protein [Spirosoma sp. KUDC1026]QKZ14758.1 NUDIX hydrolase [Spirosoma sp. KUDC1026]
MNFSEVVQQQIDDYLLNFLPSVSLDLVIFGFHEGQLKVLLLQLKGSNDWLLPGGRVGNQENLDDAAYRTLRERTGLDRLFLQQFHTFGNVNRLTYFSWQETLLRLGMKDIAARLLDDDSILKNFRDVSVGFYALVEYTQVSPTPDLLTDECRWWDIGQVPALLFDHNDMIRLALKTLRRQLSYQPVGYNLLPDSFTMTELQTLYETILGRSLDRRNFYKQMMNYNVLDRLEKRPTIPSSKAPYLYRFNQKRYEQLLSEENFSVG